MLIKVTNETGNDLFYAFVDKKMLLRVAVEYLMRI